MQAIETIYLCLVKRHIYKDARNLVLLRLLAQLPEEETLEAIIKTQPLSWIKQILVEETNFALHLAIKYNRVDVGEYILENFSVGGYLEDMATSAAMKGQFSIVRKLLKNMSSISQGNTTILTVSAIVYDNKETIYLLLERKFEEFDVNEALNIAIRYDRRELARYLYDYSPFDRSILLEAIEAGNEELVKLLAKTYFFSSEINYKEACLKEAVKSGEKILDILLTSDRTVTIDKVWLLKWALQFQNLETIMYLKDVEVPKYSGSLLLFDSRRIHDDIIDVMSRGEIKVAAYVAEKYGENLVYQALKKAIESNKVENVRLLLNKGVDLSIDDFRLVRNAIWSAGVDVVACLLKHDSSKEMLSICLEDSIKGRRTDALGLLVQHGAVIRDKHIKALAKDWKEITIKHLFDALSPENLRQFFLEIVERGAKEIIEYMLRRGINIKSYYFEALCLATLGGHRDVEKLLRNYDQKS